MSILFQRRKQGRQVFLDIYKGGTKMIEKIIKLHSVGILHKPLPQGAIELSNLTAIYAENGRGKSTFACICRSLAENDPEPLRSRETIQSEHEPTVELRISGRNYKFENGNWDNANPEILVFDSEFVDRNVYSGNRLEPEHRENLLEFVLGERGVTLKNEMDQITGMIEALNRELREKSSELSSYAKPYNVDEFVNLQPDAELDQKITRTEKKLSDTQNADAIQKRPEFKIIKLPEVKIDEIVNLLEESIETIAADAERKVREHMQKCLDEHGEQWVRQGLGYLKNDVCPFCAQILSGAEIITAYRNYFDISYENLKQKIGQSIQQVTDTLKESELDEVQRLIGYNEITQTAWADQTDITFPPTLDRDKIVTAWRDLRRALEDILGKKAESPLTRLQLPDETRVAVRQFEKVQSIVNSYNEAAQQVNNILQAIKDGLRVANIAEISETLAKLNAQKRRWDQNVKNICENYKTLLTQKKQLESMKAVKREELDLYTNQLLDEYEEAINTILERFNAGFSITKVTTEHIRGTPRAAYLLRIMGERIPISQRGGAAVGPSFRNTLSEGDKRTLALAFFLARIQLDPNLTSKVIVVDDPVSSFDMHRRKNTLKELLTLVGKCSQLIVLSHDAYFIREIEQLAGDGILVLQIRRQGNYSIFDHCNIDAICRSEYYKNYEILTRYLEEGFEGDLREIAKKIRPYLEGNLRNRFPVELRKAKNLGEMIGLIRNSEINKPLAALKPLLQELTEINEFASPFMHAENYETTSTPLTDAELIPMVKMALKIGWGS